MLAERWIEAEFQLDRAAEQAAAGQAAGQDITAIIHGLRAALYSKSGLGGRTAAAAAAGLAAAPGDLGLRRWLTSLLAEGRCYAEDPARPSRPWQAAE